MDHYTGKTDKSLRKGGSIPCIALLTLLCVIPLFVAALILKFHMLNTNYYTLYIDTQDEASFTVDEKFLSMGLDSSVITGGFENFNMSDPKLIKMMKYLSPAYLRIGGNAADEITFVRNETNPTVTHNNGSYFLSASDWMKVYNLAIAADLRIIYDLNSLLRNENGTWNSENAEDMIRFSHQKGFSVDWELGNEPNSYPKKFNASVNATQLGFDYHTLRNILNRYSLYQNSLLVGPSTTRLRTEDIAEYLFSFLRTGSESISAVTFHQYYFSGINATWEEFVDPANFDYLGHCIDDVKFLMDTVLAVDKPLWLGETSTAWHSGAPNLSDRFVGSFLWIDKLGLSAKLGVDVVIRQSIFKGNYALINESYYPNPDWWITVLYKKLVDPKVITTETEGNVKIRLYAQCAKNDNLWDDGPAIVVFGANFGDRLGYVNIKELKSDERIYSYEVTSEDTLFSQFVRLNGRTLELGQNLDLPHFKPKVIRRTDSLEIPPYSIVFWVFTNTNVVACRS